MTPRGINKRTIGSNRKVLLDLQRATFEENRERIAKHEQVLSPDFKAYEAAYSREVQQFEHPLTIPGLQAALRKSSCILVGDYHTLSIAQKSFLKLLKKVRKRRVLIGLELFDTLSQEALDKYVLHKGSERALLSKTGVKKRWPYPVWKRFKPILDLARQRGWRVVALDTPTHQGASLHERDAHMAKHLVEALACSPNDTQTFVLVGELHLARVHLPRAIREASQSILLKPLDTTVVFQNPGPIYWKLVEANLEQEVEAVQLSPLSFALNSAPPIVVQQSYLNWIDYNADTLEYDHLGYHFRKVAGKIARAISLKLEPEIHDFDVYGPGETEGWSGLPDTPEIRNEAVEFGDSGDVSHVFVEERVVYLSNLNIHHVAEVAGRLIHSLALNADASRFDGFYSQVLHNAFALFASKVVNPKRKARQLPYYRGVLSSVELAPSKTENLEVASAVLLHTQFERGRRTRAFHRLHTSRGTKRSTLTRELGFMLGEKVYYAFSRGVLSRGDLRNLLLCPLDNPESAAAFFFSLSRQVERVRIPKRM